jgi:type IV pilus assembly protein PilN
MLKINLLPVRQLKKRAKAKKQIFMMFSFFLIALAAVAVVGVLQAKKISSLNQNITTLTKEKNSYTPTLKKIAKLKKDKAEFTRRSNIIDKLKTDSSLTVRIVDEVANRIDNQRMWLDSLHQQHSSLRLSGVALDNRTIAQFMDTLKESPFIREVSLASSSLKIVSGKNLKRFELNCQVSQPAKAQTTNAVK